MNANALLKSERTIDLILVVEMFVAPIRMIVGDYGCHVVDFFEFYSLLVLQMSSFYWSLFRYVCIVHSSVIIGIGLTPVVII